MHDSLADFFEPTLRNWAGEVVGDITIEHTATQYPGHSGTRDV